MKIKAIELPFKSIAEMFLIVLLTCLGVAGVMGSLIYFGFWLLLGEQPQFKN